MARYGDKTQHNRCTIAQITDQPPPADKCLLKLDIQSDYAKVMSVEQPDAASMEFKASLEFTWLTRDMGAYFEKKRI